MVKYTVEKVDGGYRIMGQTTALFRTSVKKVFAFLRAQVPKGVTRFEVEIK